LLLVPVVWVLQFLTSTLALVVPIRHLVLLLPTVVVAARLVVQLVLVVLEVAKVITEGLMALAQPGKGMTAGIILMEALLIVLRAVVVRAAWVGTEHLQPRVQEGQV